jgi:CBS-domain-containing membrane protein
MRGHREQGSQFGNRANPTVHRIRHLPAVDSDQRLIGIVSDRDLRSACPWSREGNAGHEEKLWEFSKLKENGFEPMDPMEWFLKRFQKGQVKQAFDRAG